MPNISTPGIGSGLDIKGIISKLMSVESQPQVVLDSESVTLQSQVSAYGSLKSAVSTFRDAVAQLADLSKFKVYAATSSDTTTVDATASSTAARGVYNIVVNRIAENHRMASATTYADSGTTAIGVVGDKMTIGVGGSNFTVATGGQTLSQIRDAINSAADNSGVTASVLKDNTGFRLLLSSNDTGSAKALAVTYTGSDPFGLTTLNAARSGGAGAFTPTDLDANLIVENRYSITSSSNSLTDAIQGVTLNLKKAGSISINVNRDTAAVQSAVNGVAKSYSDLVGTMKKMRGDVLKSDNSVLLNLESQLRGVLNGRNQASSRFANVFELGLSTQKDGTLTVDSSALNKALQSDFDGVANLFADATSGIAKKLTAVADGFLATGGPLDGRTQGLDSELRQNTSKKNALQVRLQQIQLRYTQQFNALDSVISQLNQTSNLVTQQLTALTNNPIK